MLPNRLSYIKSAFSQSRIPSILLLLIFVLWLLLQIILCFKLGLKIPPDAVARYLPYAKQIAFHNYIDFSRDIRYVGYTFIIALLLKTGQPLWLLIGIQVSLAAVALFLLYRTTAALTQSRICALLATALTAISQDIQQWNFYILTESLFTSALVICFSTLVLCRKKPHLFWIIPVWLYTCILRPNGFIILAAATSYAFTVNFQKASQKQKIWSLYAVGAVSILFLLLINQLIGPFTLVETYARGEVIFATSRYGLTPSSSLHLPPSDISALQKLFLFFWYNPIYTIKLIFIKGFTFLAFAKPYFSKYHNLIIFLTVYPCYVLAFKAFRNKVNLPSIMALYTIVALQTIMVMLTVEDWDCRFTAPILPFVFILGAMGIKNTYGHKLPAWDKTPN